MILIFTVEIETFLYKWLQITIVILEIRRYCFFLYFKYTNSWIHRLFPSFKTQIFKKA